MTCKGQRQTDRERDTPPPRPPTEQHGANFLDRDGDDKHQILTEKLDYVKERSKHVCCLLVQVMFRFNRRVYLIKEHSSRVENSR